MKMSYCTEKINFSQSNNTINNNDTKLQFTTSNSSIFDIAQKKDYESNTNVSQDVDPTNPVQMALQLHDDTSYQELEKHLQMLRFKDLDKIMACYHNTDLISDILGKKGLTNDERIKLVDIIINIMFSNIDEDHLHITNSIEDSILDDALANKTNNSNKTKFYMNISTLLNSLIVEIKSDFKEKIKKEINSFFGFDEENVDNLSHNLLKEINTLRDIISKKVLQSNYFPKQDNKYRTTVDKDYNICVEDLDKKDSYIIDLDKIATFSDIDKFKLKAILLKKPAEYLINLSKMTGFEALISFETESPNPIFEEKIAEQLHNDVSYMVWGIFPSTSPDFEKHLDNLPKNNSIFEILNFYQKKYNTSLFSDILCEYGKFSKEERMNLVEKIIDKMIAANNVSDLRVELLHAGAIEYDSKTTNAWQQISDNYIANVNVILNNYNPSGYKTEFLKKIKDEMNGWGSLDTEKIDNLTSKLQEEIEKSKAFDDVTDLRPLHSGLNAFYGPDKNGRYEITVDKNENITVKDTEKNQTYTIDLDKICLYDFSKKDKLKLKLQLLKMPADFLIDFSKEAILVNDCEYFNNTSYLGRYNQYYENISCKDWSDIENTLVHEVGHAMDWTLESGANDSSFEKNYSKDYYEELEEYIKAGNKTFGGGNLDRSVYCTKDIYEMFADGYTLAVLGYCNSQKCIQKYFPKTYENIKKHIEDIRSRPQEQRQIRNK